MKQLSSAAKEHLTAALQSTSRLVRRETYRLVMETVGPHRVTLIRVAVASSDPVLRLWGTRDCGAVLKGEELEVTLGRRAADRFMPVRRQALMVSAECFPAQARSIWAQGLRDRSGPVREYARFYLTKMGVSGFAEVYRGLLRHPQQRFVAVAGLGETGGKEDIDLVRPYLSDKSATLRQGAVRSLGLLGGEEVAEDLQRRLSDSSKRVAFTAARALMSRQDQLDPASLLTLVREAEQQHVALATLQLLNRLDFWRALPIFLEVGARRDDRVAGFARCCILAGVNRIWSRPSLDQVAAIREALQTHGVHLPERLLTQCLLWLE